MLLGTLALGCKAGHEKPGGEADAETAATPVRVTPVRKGPIVGSVRGLCSIEAEREATMYAEVTGRITKLSVEEGDDVEANAVLARIEADVQAAGLDRARANLEQRNRELTRLQDLNRRGIASQEEIEAARLAVQTARLDLEDRKRDVGNTTVTAPFSGTITERFVSQSELVSAGTQMLRLTDFTSLIAPIRVPERALDDISVGQVADIEGKALERSAQGIVKRIAPFVDPNTGTVKIVVEIPPFEQQGARTTQFLPGMLVAVRVTTRTVDDALLIPKHAVLYDRAQGKEQPFVFVVQDGVAKRYDVTLGLAADDDVQVLTGVSEGNPIVTAGQMGLSDGGKVTLEGETAPADEAKDNGKANGKDNDQGTAA